MELREPSAKYLANVEFKQSEVGLIPLDWSPALIGEIASVSAGGTPSRKLLEYWNGDIPWVTTTELNQKRVVETEQRITRRGLENSSAKLVAPGAVLIALYGQGKTRGKVSMLEIKAATNQACAAIVVFPTTSNRFVFHSLYSQYRSIRLLSNAGSQDNLSSGIVKDIQVALPPTLTEQQDIAGALSDADALIESLEQLLAKKRQIKQGAMQELLTGQRRLPGFTGDWVSGDLGDALGELVAGVSVNSEAQGATEGVPSVLKTSAIYDGQFDPSECKAIAKTDVGRAQTTPRKDSLLVSRMNTPALVGEVGYVDADYPLLFLPDRVWMAQAKHGSHVNMRWLVSLLSSAHYKQRIRDAATGTSGSMKNISKTALRSLSVQFPCGNEQTAIATVLSDMDTEITALEARLTKARQLKQGMAQALLTGRIRLV